TQGRRDLRGHGWGGPRPARALIAWGGPWALLGPDPGHRPSPAHGPPLAAIPWAPQRARQCSDGSCSRWVPICSRRGRVQRSRRRAAAMVMQVPRTAPARSSWGYRTPPTTRETAAARAITWALVAHQLLMTRTMAVASAKEMVVWLRGKDQLPAGGQDGSSTITRQGRSWTSTA